MTARRRTRTKVRIPGGPRPWFHVMPEEYRDNPNVVVVLVKKGARTRIAPSPDGFQVGILDTKRGARGLQVIGASGTYADHTSIIEGRYRLPMADAKYIGPLSRLPDRVLLDEEFPLFFLKDALGTPFLNFKQFIWNISKGDDGRFN